MLSLLSPAKTLDYETPATTDTLTTPDFLDHSAELVEILKKKSVKQIGKLMGISEKLATLNHERFQTWQNPMPPAEVKQAVLAFKGDVYLGLEAGTLTAKQLGYAQDHLRILSGLYGMLRPLDAMLPYRLEMGTKLKTSRGSDLYSFWGASLTAAINEQLAATKSKYLINLASNEYFQSVRAGEIEANIISPTFKDLSNGKYKIISFFAKKARGMMAAYLIRGRVKTLKKLTAFDSDGYRYDEESSTESKPVFLRG
ncbi:MAG: peroxide stress protein YaaA [Planctomycetota bacterium]